MKKAFFAAAVAATFVCAPQLVVAKSVTLNFDVYEDLFFDTHPEEYYGVEEAEIYCVWDQNIKHCDENFQTYNHVAPYKLLSDYDFESSTTYTAREGYYFDPIGFDILSAFSQVWRVDCATSSEPDDCFNDPTGFEWSNTDEFDELVVYDWVELTGYRDGEVVATTAVDLIGASDYQFTSDFTQLDTLEIELLASYFYGAVVKADGYAYSCVPNGNEYCNDLSYDNFQMNVYAAGGSVAPVPLPSAGAGLLGALAVLGFARSRLARRAS